MTNLIKNILDTGIELAISLHAKPYDTADAQKKIKTVKSSVRREMIKSQKAAAKEGYGVTWPLVGRLWETSETEK